MLELPRGVTGRVPSINNDPHMHASDSQDRGKPEQAKAKAMPFKRVKEDRVFERPSWGWCLLRHLRIWQSTQGAAEHRISHQPTSA